MSGHGVTEILKDPPDWLEQSYLAGYLEGTVSLKALTWAVTAALGHSPHEWGERLLPNVREAVGDVKLVVWA